MYATEITDDSAKLTFEIPARNERADQASVTVRAQLFDEMGHSVALFEDKGYVVAGDTRTFKFGGVILHPTLWEPDYPHVYRVECSLVENGNRIDSTSVPLGIRSVHWDAQSGFFINGHHLKLHGWGQKPTDEWAGLVRRSRTGSTTTRSS